MRWLLLCDIHVGRPDQAQSAGLAALIDAIVAAMDGHPFDFVVLAGDLGYAGTSQDYDEFTRTFLAPLRKRLGTTPLFLCVPGNHDLDCDQSLPIAWDQIGKQRQNLFFQNTADGKKTRHARAQAFAAYSAFVQKENLISFDPTERCSTTHRLNTVDGYAALVLLNTALLSDKHSTDKQLTPAPTLALRNELSEHPDAHPILLFGHHPIDWFLHGTQQPFKTILFEKGAVYIHGHLHRVQVTTSMHGLESLGFGAVYQESLDAKPDAVYRNSFAICELHDALHVAIHSWDSVNGRWVPDTHLPPEFSKESALLPHGYVLTFPQLSTKKRPPPSGGSGAGPRRAPTIDGVMTTGTPSASAWRRLLRILGFQVQKDAPYRAPKPGVFEFDLTDASGKRLVHCISAPAHVLSKREIEAHNTTLDAGEHDALTIVSLGLADEEARTLALRLAAKKAFEVLTNKDLPARASEAHLRSLAEHVDELDAAQAAASLVLLGDSIGLLVEERLHHDWFYVLAADAAVVPETSPSVLAIRESHPSRARATYQPPGTEGVAPPKESAPVFDRADYLKACQAEFNAIKYAPLAAMGAKLPNAKLRDVYVPARAERADDALFTASIQQLIDDVLDTIKLEPAQRAQLERQMREQFPAFGMRESGAARAFYHENNHVLLLGDPGSGKTCFVKNEILTYCSPPETSPEWYAHHVPVYVSLAEAASLTRDGNSLLDATTTLATRRGLPISSAHLQTLMSGGHVAFFFDGLDEVSSLEQRAATATAVSNLLTEWAPRGNRFVLTSRPAAVRPIEIPRGLTTLHLQGLSTSEIRELAWALLSVELAEGGEKLQFAKEGTSAARATLDKLFADCEANPGIGRLARNPLLLTLLVMIYANSGAPSAKRHRIYAQAVGTLVVVRNRNPGQPVPSEADLRKRLGHLALAIYENRASELPDENTVVALLAESMNGAGSEPHAREDAVTFLQFIAETTGLLVLHSQSGAASTVTFMHHSFLEYYAACGLLAERDIATLPELALQPRWRDIITLVAGIVGDQQDVTPLIERMLAAKSEEEPITQARLIFAFDCALECDVPPEASQRCLVDAADAAIRRGPGLVDPDFRAEIADRLGLLFAAAGSSRVRDLVVRGIGDDDERVCAAFVEVASRMAIHAELPGALVGMIPLIAARRESAVRTALFGAMERSPQFRTDEALAALRLGFAGSMTVRFAAARAVEGAPALAKAVWDEVIAATDDSQSPVANAAARALLEAGLGSNIEDDSQRILLEKCLRLTDRFIQSSTRGARPRLQPQREVLDRLLSSPRRPERLLGIRLLPWLEREEAFILKRVMEICRADGDGGMVAAALTAFRLAPGVAQLSTFADVETIAKLIDPKVQQDVRIGACHALAAMPQSDAILERLLARARNVRYEEFSEVIRAIVDYAAKEPEVQEFVFESTSERLKVQKKGAFGDANKQMELRRLMAACEDLKVDAPAQLSNRLANLADNYKASVELRQHAVRTFARTVRPSVGACNQLIDWLLDENPLFRNVIGAAVSDFVRRARQKIDHVRAIYDELGRLKAAVIESWDHSKVGASPHTDDPVFRGLRLALKDVSDLVIAFAEFSERQRVGSGHHALAPGQGG